MIKMIKKITELLITKLKTFILFKSKFGKVFEFLIFSIKGSLKFNVYNRKWSIFEDFCLIQFITEVWKNGKKFLRILWMAPEFDG